MSPNYSWSRAFHDQITNCKETLQIFENIKQEQIKKSAREEAERKEKISQAMKDRWASTECRAEKARRHQEAVKAPSKAKAQAAEEVGGLMKLTLANDKDIWQSRECKAFEKLV